MPSPGGARRPCSGLWNTPMVYVDGDVTTCCLDQDLENVLGNVSQRPFDEIWNGPTNHAWRLAQILGRFAESGPYCTRCNWRSAGAMPHEKVLAWLERAGEDEVAAIYRRRWGLR